MRRMIPPLLAVAILVAPRLQAQYTAASERSPFGVQRALVRFQRVFARQEVDSIAGWFLPDGRIGGRAGAPKVGPDSIAAHLRRFADYHLLGDSLVADSLRFFGDSATQLGHYWQRVALPSRDTVEAHGTFTAEWRWLPGRGWRLQSLMTDP